MKLLRLALKKMLVQIRSDRFSRSEKFNRILAYFQSAWHRHPFRLALCVSLIIHVVFLSIRWGVGEIQNRRLNTPLSVVLVNASNKTPPKQANKLAQADLQGGGKSDTQDAIKFLSEVLVGFACISALVFIIYAVLTWLG